MSLDLLAIEDPEAFEFFAAARKSLQASAPRPAPAADDKPVLVDGEPDLSDLTGMPDGPHPDDVIDSSWVLATMQAKLDARRRLAANTAARKAGECQATGKWARDWHASRYDAVLSLLASAEVAALDVDRPWHAARFDAYVAAHGLRGWHRTTDLRGKHDIQLNLIRTREEGDRGRHYVHAAYRPLHGPANYWVVDRDTGRTVYRTVASGIARQWIEEAEAAS